MHIKRVLLYALPILFISSAFLFPSINANYLETAIWLIIVLALLVFRNEIRIKINRETIAIIAFAFAGLIISSFSNDLYTSFHKALFIIEVVSIFILLGSLGDRMVLDLSSKYLVILSSIFTIFAFTNYIEVGQLPYNYISGIFGHSESYSVFICLPLFIAIYLIYHSSDRLRHVWSVCAGILIVGLVLSGSYLPIIQALIFVLLGLTSQLKNFNFRLLGLTSQTVFFAIIIYCLVIYGARANTLSYGQEYNDSLINKSYVTILQNSNTARGYYILDGLFAFLNEPLKGHGLDSFDNALRLVKTGLYYGSDTASFSLFLHNLVEGGIIYFLIFVIFVCLLFLKFLRINRQEEIFAYLITLLLFSQLFHSIYGSGLNNNTSLLIWFVFAGLVYSLVLPKRIVISYKTVSGKIILQTTIALTIIIAMLEANLARAVYYKQKAEPYLGSENSFAILYLSKSLSYNSFDASTWYMLWKAYYLSNKLDQAQFAIKKALDKSVNDSNYLYILANTEMALDQKEDYREYLIKSLKYDQISDIQRYLDLVQYDYEQNKYAEAISYGEKIVKIYEDFVKAGKENYRTISKSDIEIINKIKSLIKEMK